MWGSFLRSLIWRHLRRVFWKLEESPEGAYDVILMDVMMPVMDGLEATRKIRASQREEGRKIPIIALTANAFREDMEQCTREGMNAHLAKPMELEKMIHTIAEMTRKNR